MHKGEKVEDFELPDENGDQRRLSDLLAGGPVVLFFYPGAMTYGCTKESCHFRDLKEEFVSVGAQRVGISTDTVDKQKQFSDKYSFDYPLLSDADGSVARQLGVKRSFGPIPVKRTTFVIDTDRTVLEVIHSEFSMSAHADRALEILGHRVDRLLTAGRPVSVIAISGSASGIGAACAHRLEAAGHRVVGIDLHEADVAADLGTPEGRLDAITGVADRADGVLDGLVTCAGVAGAPWRPGSLLASVNYFGTVALLEGLRPLLAAAPAPAAVAISSNSTTIQPGVPEALAERLLTGDEAGARELADAEGSMLAYPATKLAVAYWVRTRAVGHEWAGAGIRLNAVAPGMVETPLVAEGRADPDVAPLLEMLPLPVGRAGRPEEIAALVALLLGDDGGFFCGSVLFCDGGTDALLRARDWPLPWPVDMKAAGAALRAGPGDAH